jgi:hypothetical protein
MTIAKRHLNRREALMGGAGLVGGGALAALTAMPALAESEGSTGLEGAWLVDVTPDTGTIAPHQVLTLYTKGGGVAAISDNSPNSGSTGFGAWQSAGENKFLQIFELFTFDTAGQFAGILRIRSVSSIDETRDNMTGQAHIDFQPPGAPTFFPAGTTHFTASRIKVIPF